MRITCFVLTSVVSMAAALPALAQGNGGCPPGLAMKGCVPPGQAKKMGNYVVAPTVVYQQPVYQPPVAYVPVYPAYPAYPDYPPSHGSLNLGVTVPLQ